MTDSRTRSAETPGGNSRALFAERFALLYVTAGDPPLKRVADSVERTRRLDERGRPVRAGAQRISDWRRGRNVPARFGALAVVLETLIGEARKRQPQPPVDGLYDVAAWKRLWTEALNTPISGTAEPAADAGAEPQPPEDSGVCPYRGLAAFQREDSAWFFGRDGSTGTLVDRLGLAAEDGGITVLVGASGAGKSSLLRAGLAPALAAGALPGSQDWPVLTATPGEDPLKSLITLVPQLNEVLGGGEPVPDEDAAQFRFAEAVRDAVAARARELGGEAARLVLVVDQFEETFTVCRDESARALFVQALHAVCTTGFAAGDAPGLVVLGLRADFYGRCLDFPELAEALQQRQMVLGAMSTAELRKAITGPARAVGLQIEPGLVDVLLRDLGVGVGRAYGKPGQRAYDAGALPLLSHALLVTWQRRQGGRLTIAGYRAAGGIQGAVAGTAERAWAELDERGQAAARQVLLRLVHVGEDTQDTRRRAQRSEIIERAEQQEATARALDVLAAARLVTLDADSVEISHEALLYAWPRLRGWIDQDRAGNLARQRLERDAESWAAEDRDPSLLYRGARLEAARHWAAQAVSGLSAVSQEFLTASIRHRRRASWFRRSGVAAVCVLAVIAGVAALVAVREKDDAQFRQVLAQADQLQSIDPSAAARLNLVADELRPGDGGVFTRLLSTQNAPLGTPMHGHEGSVYLTTFSPDGRTLATAGYDRTVRLWDVRDRSRPVALGAPITGFGSWVTSAVFSPDGRTLAAAGDDGKLRFYDVRDPAHPRPLGPPVSRGDGTIYLIAFSPDGRTLAAANENGTARLWDVADPARPAPGAELVGHTAQVRTLAFSPDGGKLATGGDDRTVRLWDVADPAHPSPLGGPLTGHTEGLHSVAFSPDGSTVASGSVDKTIRLWDVRDPARASQAGPVLTGHRGAVWSLKFSPDGRTLASGSADSTAKLWNVTDLRNPTQLGPDLAAGGSTVFAVGFAPDGRSLATGSDDGVVRLWSLPDRILAGHTSSVSDAVFSPDGRTLVTSSEDRTLRVWDTTDKQHPEPIGGPLQVYTGPTGSVYSEAFRPDGKVLASGGGLGMVRLWDFSDREHPRPLGEPLRVGTRYVGEVGFSPDGTILATGHDDQSVQLWDVRDPAHPVRVGAPLTGHTGYVNGLDFSPDGRLLVTASSDGSARIWDIGDPAHARLLGRPLTAHGAAVNAAHFSPDGATLVTAATDKTARLWDVTDPAHPKQRGEPLTGHTQSIKEAVFSPDGKTLATGSEDRSVRLWDVSDPDAARPIGQSLTEHTSVVNSVRFSPDGTTLASASSDNTAHLWDLDVGHAIRRICASTRGVLPQARWEELIPQIDHRPLCRG